MQATATIAHLRLGNTTLSAHLHRPFLSLDPFSPWCMTIPETILPLPMLPLPPHCTTLTEFRLSALAITILRHPPLPAICYPLPILCLLEKDHPATTPVIPTQDYPMAHKDS
ncbi:hypothetical protein E2C01_087799 [Portunus trituberculatus]|uniref:Uncharacterized protein n=1 Tax=Portunus trituberculatus TaxID=210409 RepID=A0A5B7JDH0_PORTR|nr:hypothetical protein [Portunus trituberculatus]